MALTLMVIAPIMCVGGVIMAINEGALSTLLLVAIRDGRLHRRRCGPGGAAVPDDAGQDRPHQPGAAPEQITGVRVIRAFVRTEPRAAFRRRERSLTATALRVNRIFALVLPALMAILNLSTVAVLWFGGLRRARGLMPIGNLTAFSP